MAELASPPAFNIQLPQYGAMLLPRFDVPKYTPMQIKYPDPIAPDTFSKGIQAAFSDMQQRQDSASAREAAKVTNENYLKLIGNRDAGNDPSYNSPASGNIVSRGLSSLGHLFGMGDGDRISPTDASTSTSTGGVRGGLSGLTGPAGDLTNYKVGPSGVTFSPPSRDANLDALTQQQVENAKMQNEEKRRMLNRGNGSGGAKRIFDPETNQYIDSVPDPLPAPGSTSASPLFPNARKERVRTTSFDGPNEKTPDPETRRGESSTGYLIKPTPTTAGTAAVDPDTYPYGTIFVAQDGTVHVAGDRGDAVVKRTASGGTVPVVDIYKDESQPDYQDLQVIPPLVKNYAALTPDQKLVYHQTATAHFGRQTAPPETRIGLANISGTGIGPTAPAPIPAVPNAAPLSLDPPAPVATAAPLGGLGLSLPAVPEVPNLSSLGVDPATLDPTAAVSAPQRAAAIRKQQSTVADESGVTYQWGNVIDTPEGPRAVIDPTGTTLIKVRPPKPRVIRNEDGEPIFYDLGGGNIKEVKRDKASGRLVIEDVNEEGKPIQRLIDKEDGKTVAVFGPKKGAKDTSALAGPEPFRRAFELATIGVKEEDKKTIKQALAERLAEGDDEGAKETLRRIAVQGMSEESRKRVTSSEQAAAQLEQIKKDLKAYKDAGGETGPLADVREKLYNFVGQTNDPKLLELRNQINANLYQYRNTLSGAAFSKQEAADYAAIFPSVRNSEALNTAAIDAAVRYFGSTAEGGIKRSVGPKNYDAIFKSDEKPKGEEKRPPLISKGVALDNDDKEALRFLTANPTGELAEKVKVILRNKNIIQ